MAADGILLYESANSQIRRQGEKVTKSFLRVTSNVPIEISVHFFLSGCVSGVCRVTSMVPFQREIEMEFCANGSLRQELRKRGLERLAEDELLRRMESMMKTVREIHEKRYVHRVISADNWLVTSDLSMKLSDFGYAMEIPQGGSVIPHTQYSEGGSRNGYSERIFANDALQLGKLFLQMATLKFDKITFLSNAIIEESCEGYSNKVSDIIKSLIFLGNVSTQREVRAKFEDMRLTLEPERNFAARVACDFCLRDFYPRGIDNIADMQCIHFICPDCIGENARIPFCFMCKNDSRVETLTERVDGNLGTVDFEL